MDGEITDRDFVASMPVRSAGNKHMLTEEELLFIPTRLKERLGGSLTENFVGILPSDSFHKTAVDVDFYYLSNTLQLLLGGIVCPDNCWRNDIGCRYTGEHITGADSSDNKSTSLIVIPPPRHNIASNHSNPNNDCPVCKWLREGPCSAEYLEWDAAMENFNRNSNEENKERFFTTAATMASCCRCNEYYDVYVAFL
jgi:hypothetical protein